MKDAIEREWERLAARCDEQSVEWERVRAELHAIATDALGARLSVGRHDELLTAFDDASEVRRPTTGALPSGVLSMTRG